MRRFVLLITIWCCCFYQTIEPISRQLILVGASQVPRKLAVRAHSFVCANRDPFVLVFIPHVEAEYSPRQKHAEDIAIHLVDFELGLVSRRGGAGFLQHRTGLATPVAVERAGIRHRVTAGYGIGVYLVVVHQHASQSIRHFNRHLAGISIELNGIPAGVDFSTQMMLRICIKCIQVHRGKIEGWRILANIGKLVD